MTSRDVAVPQLDRARRRLAVVVVELDRVLEKVVGAAVVLGRLWRRLFQERAKLGQEYDVVDALGPPDGLHRSMNRATASAVIQPPVDFGDRSQ